MAKKRRRKKARRSRRSNPKRAHRRKKARRSTTPTRRRRHARRRAHKRNPSRRRHRVRGHFARRKGRRVRVRAHVSNPFKKRRKSGRRGRRRNPGGMIGQVALAVLAAIGGFLGTFAIGYFITPASQLASSQQTYRGGVGVAGAAGGYFLAKKHPAIGLGLAAGSILGAVGGFLMTKLIGMLPQKSGGAQNQQTTKGLAAVFTNNFGAVYQDNMQGYSQQLGGYNQQMNAVFNSNMAGMLGMGDAHDGGEFAPAAPWQTATPFDHRGL